MSAYTDRDARFIAALTAGDIAVTVACAGGLLYAAHRLAGSSHPILFFLPVVVVFLAVVEWNPFAVAIRRETARIDAEIDRLIEEGITRILDDEGV